MAKLQTLTLFVCACLGLAAPARADAVVDWNIIALQAISTANRGAAIGQRFRCAVSVSLVDRHVKIP